MPRDAFIDDLRQASRALERCAQLEEKDPVSERLAPWTGDPHFQQKLAVCGAIGHEYNALWLAKFAIRRFAIADFADWSFAESEALAKEVDAVVELTAGLLPSLQETIEHEFASELPATAPGERPKWQRARNHLNRVLEIVRARVLGDWLAGLQRLVENSTSVSNARGWAAEPGEKPIAEDFLGAYAAPLLRIHALGLEMLLEPIARYGNRRRGTVSLTAWPTTADGFVLEEDNDRWTIVSPQGKAYPRPFDATTFADTIASFARD